MGMAFGFPVRRHFAREASTEACFASWAVAPSLGIRLQIALPRGPEEFEESFASFRREGAGAVVVFGSELVAIHRKTLATLALKHRLPAIYQAGAYVTDGGFMSYGPDFREHTRLLADTLDKILRGAKAAEPDSAADEVRASDQPEDREGTRPDDPSVGAGSSGSARI